MSQQTDRFRSILIGMALGAIAGSFFAYMISSRKNQEEPLEEEEEELSTIVAFDHNGEAHETQKQSSEHSIFWSSLSGAILGAIGGLLIGQKPTEMAFSDIYQKVNDRTVSLVEDFNHAMEESRSILATKTSGWAEKFLITIDELAEEVSDWASTVKEAAEKARYQAAVYGEGVEKQQRLSQIYEWAEKAENASEFVIRELGKWPDKIRQIAKDDKPISQEILDWAVLGLDLWKNIKNEK